MIDKESYMQIKTLEDGRNNFADSLKKYKFDEESTEQLKDYYGYFWNRAKNDNIPVLYKNMFLFCDSKIVAESVYETIANQLLNQGLIQEKAVIGCTYLDTQKDVDEIKEMFSEKTADSEKMREKRERYVSLIVAMKRNNSKEDEINPREILKQEGTGLFYRDFRDHLICNAKESDIVCMQICDEVEKGHTITEEFHKDLKDYINAIYETRELRDSQKFIKDVLERIWNKYYGKYEEGAVLDADCVPDYIKKKNEKEDRQLKEEKKETADVIDEKPIIIEEIADIEEQKLENESIKNVLLLSMSIFPKNKPILNKNTYKFEGVSNIEGYGQLEPVPQLLCQSLEKKHNSLDLIIIMASAATKKQKNFAICCDERNINYYGSEIDFFKKRIQDTCGKKVAFKVIDTENSTGVDLAKPQKNIPEALGNIVAMIRKIKEHNSDMVLYLDMHGGQREEQLLLDAIINTLNIEKIKPEKAYNISGGGKDAEIKDVTEHLNVFQFVSSMNEFINFGYGKGMKDYVGNEKFATSEEGEEYQKIANGIAGISEALALCQVAEFEEALDCMVDAIEKVEKKGKVDHYLDIFIANIKKDYDGLLKPKKRSLSDEINWAKQKGFYQQCLAMIEAKTPGYVFQKYIPFREDAIIIMKKEVDGSSRRMTMNEFVSIEHNSNEGDQSCIARTLLYCKNVKYHIENGMCRIELVGYTSGKIQKGKKSKDDYQITFQSNLTDKSVFEEFRCIWKRLKNKRNIIMHVSERPQKKFLKKEDRISVEQINEDITEYLKYIALLDKHAKEDKIPVSADKKAAEVSIRPQSQQKNKKKKQTISRNEHLTSSMGDLLKGIDVSRK